MVLRKEDRFSLRNDHNPWFAQVLDRSQKVRTGLEKIMANNSYQLLKDVHEAINRLEDKFDQRTVSLEQRVSTLEKFRYYLLGAIAVTVFAVEYVLKKIIGRN